MSGEIDQTLHRILRDLLLLNSAADRHVLAQHDLRQTRYYVLHHLYHNPDLTLAQLSELVLIYSASASRMVHSMETEGLVVREADPTDRRQFTLRLTENGRKFYETVSADLAADVAARFAELSPEALAALVAHGLALRDALAAHCRQQEVASS